MDSTKQLSPEERKLQFQKKFKTKVDVGDYYLSVPMEKLDDMILKMGKHKGEKFIDILDDQDYCRWIYNHKNPSKGFLALQHYLKRLKPEDN